MNQSSAEVNENPEPRPYTLKDEDSEADFAVKILNCPLAPADLKEVAIKQLRVIQKRKIRRRTGL
jgi:hypothetical protein